MMTKENPRAGNAEANDLGDQINLSLLASAGVPLFAMRAVHDFQPGSRREFHYPDDWQQTPATGQVPHIPTGGAVCAVTGHVVDVVDVDTKNGANVDAERQRLRDCGVAIVAEVRTPSGGAHFYVAASGIRSSAHPSNGIDFRGGGNDGGRGNVFLPGTSRPAYGGAGYAWVTPLDVTMLADLDHEDQSDALWTYLQGRGIEPKLEADPQAATVGGEPVDHDIPAHIAERLSLLSVPDRSAHFHGTVGACKLAGFTQGQTVTLLTPWCNAVGKYAGRVAAEVARSWAKIKDNPHQHIREDVETGAGKRRLTLTSAASIEPQRVRWLWLSRIALGALSLLAGPEGLGKSTLAYWIVALVTLGKLPGEHFGQPRSVLVAASEDSWAHTIVPRLIAAEADLTRVFRVDVTTTLGTESSLSLPVDIPALSEAAAETDAALLLLDPLTSRLHGSLDTHKDSETRQALEPLVRFADQSQVAVVGIMHFNKSGSTDPLSLVMASKAFTAVARSVSVVVKDPDDPTEARRLFGTPKNNLGRSDLPTLGFTIAGHCISTADGEAWTGKLVWGADAEGTISDALSRVNDDGNRTATAEAEDWLHDYLVSQGGSADSARVKKAGSAAGHSHATLHRARKRLGVTTETRGFPRKSEWILPAEGQDAGSPQSFHTVVSTARGDETNEMNETTGQSGHTVIPVVSVVSVVSDGGVDETTGASAPVDPNASASASLLNLLADCTSCGVQTHRDINPCRNCQAKEGTA